MSTYGLSIAADVIWQNRVISSTVIHKKNRIRLGGSQNCDLILPGYSSKLADQVIKTEDFIQRGLSKLKFTYLEGLIQVNLRLADPAEEVPGESMLPLSWSEKAALLMSMILASLMAFFLQTNRPQRLPKLMVEELRPPSKIIFMDKVRPKKQITKRKPNKRRKDVGSLGILGASKELMQSAKADSLNKLAEKLKGYTNSNGSSTQPELQVISGGNRQSVSSGGSIGESIRKNRPLGTGGIGHKGKVQIQTPFQNVEVTGSMDRNAIRQVIKDHLSEIRYCYERALAKDSNLAGKVVLQWNIVSSGRVQSAKVLSNSMDSSPTANCLVQRLKNWDFPEPPENSIGQVIYPFVFNVK